MNLCCFGKKAKKTFKICPCSCCTLGEAKISLSINQSFSQFINQSICTHSSHAHAPTRHTESNMVCHCWLTLLSFARSKLPDTGRWMENCHISSVKIRENDVLLLSLFVMSNTRDARAGDTHTPSASALCFLKLRSVLCVRKCVTLQRRERNCKHQRKATY